MPALVDEHDLDAWLAWAVPGTQVAYHLGLSVGAERSQDEALDLLARATARAHTTTLSVTAAPCGHPPAAWQARLTSRLSNDAYGNKWLYIAVGDSLALIPIIDVKFGLQQNF